MNLWRLSLRSLRREWHLPELRTLAASLVLAVVALGVVATLATRIERGMLASAAELIGGDLGISSPQALPATYAEQARADGLSLSRTASFPSVAFAHEQAQLLDVQAVDATYPLRGTLELGGTAERRSGGPASGEVYLDHRALVALNLKVGQPLQLGGRELTIAAELIRQPDGGELLALAPRALMNLADAEQAGLLGVGSRARHRLLLAGTPTAVQRWRDWTQSTGLPQGAQLITPEQTQERMRSAFDRAGAFLRLTALLSALLAGIAIALSAQRYARRKTAEVALLRALGTPRRRVLALLLGTLAALAVPATSLGIVLALGLSQLAWLLASQLFGNVPTLLPLLPAFAAAAMGIAVLVGFALPPLARLAEVPPVAVFRQSLQRRVRRFDALYLIPLLVALGLIWSQSSSLQLAGILAASLLGVALIAALLSGALLWLARRIAPGAHPALRLGLAALARRPALSVIQATALSLGLCALLLLAVVAPSLLQGWRQELPADAPNWFALNLQDDQRPGFAQSLAATGGDQLNMLPLAVGKLTAINGRPIDQLHFEDPRAKEWVDRQLRLSWSAELPPANEVVAGHWQGAHPARAEVSVDTMWRDMFALKPGDTMSFDVGEGRIDATVSSVRKVDWSSFRVNFFLLLDPAHAGDLPHSWLASFHLPRGHATQLAQLSRDYPNLSLVDVDALLDRVREIIERVGNAVRWILGFSLLAGALVLIAALASSAAERRHEAALLRTLGARRGQLRVAAACEFALLGLVAGLTAAFGAAGAGLWLGQAVFHIEGFVPPFAPLALAALLAAFVVMLLGLAGTRTVSRTPPMRLLREG
ncbi:Putative ABC-type transport system involved in lysophospholipase L1 biosynthesis, permease component [Rhodanobacter sp. Root179]|uniref:ABC transporter permease n=1 Tax=Rhodanobacter sp. Root179 TaxID=1736482 RepID=UPI0006FFC1CB|nr:FtsX-like permease family protein [Rhodanobacter sp. Root179]KRB39482.1 ABC transporter permease [Rhodanobacter sp. Root179]